MTRTLIIGVLTAAFLFPSVSFALIPNDNQWKQTTSTELIHLSDAWDISTNARAVVVAVIDSGVDITHPDLAENIWVNEQEQLDGADNDNNGFIDDLNGWNFVNNTPSVRPNPTAASSTKIGIQHGTVVAGIIGAVGNNNIGGAGVAWRVKIMPLKILGENGDGDSDMAVKAIDYAIKQKADIINLSFVGQTPSRNFIQAIRRAYRAGIVVVAAAGNAPENGIGINLDITPHYPVCFDDPLQEENWVIGVAALDTEGNLASFSNYGKRCVDISAPGKKIPSLLFFEPAHGFFDLLGGTWSGTSVAAPYVTGVAALIKGLQPTWGPEEIRRALLENVDPLRGNDTNVAGRGILNAFKAVRYAARGGNARSPDGTVVATGQIRGVPQVTLFDRSLNSVISFPVARTAVNGTNVVLADVENSGVTSVIAAVPDRRGTLIRIFNRDGKLVREFRPFGSAVRTSISLASGDLTGDGIDELLVGAPSRRMARVLSPEGVTQLDIPIPERGNFFLEMITESQRPFIATIVPHATDYAVYVWDTIGAFERLYTIPRRVTAKRAEVVGAADRFGTGARQLYVATTSGPTVNVQFFLPDGKPDITYAARAARGAVFGFTFGPVNGAETPQLLIGSQAGGVLAYDTASAGGMVSSTVDTRLVRSPWRALYFGR